MSSCIANVTRVAALIVLSVSTMALGDTPTTESKTRPEDASELYPTRDSIEASTYRGRIAFEHYCTLCHGWNGDGTGRAARLYNPRPANLTKSDKNAAYKELIIRRGGEPLGRAPAMPPWSEELTEEQINDVVNYLGTLVAPPTGGK